MPSYTQLAVSHRPAFLAGPNDPITALPTLPADLEAWFNGLPMAVQNQVKAQTTDLVRTLPEALQVQLAQQFAAKGETSPVPIPALNGLAGLGCPCMMKGMDGLGRWRPRISGSGLVKAAGSIANRMAHLPAKALKQDIALQRKILGGAVRFGKAAVKQDIANHRWVSTNARGFVHGVDGLGQWDTLFSGLLNAGTQLYNQHQAGQLQTNIASSTNAANAQIAQIQADASVQMQTILAQAQVAATQATASSKSSMLKYVVIFGGIAALLMAGGGAVYLAKRKKS
jgi:hypothetical protein